MVTSFQLVLQQVPKFFNSKTETCLLLHEKHVTEGQTSESDCEETHLFCCPCQIAYYFLTCRRLRWMVSEEMKNILRILNEKHREDVILGSLHMKTVLKWIIKRL